MMFRLSGTIDVLLFLIARPHLLLFPRPEKLAEPDIELDSRGTSSAISPDISLRPIVAGEGSGNSAAQSRVGPRRMSDDI